MGLHMQCGYKKKKPKKDCYTNKSSPGEVADVRGMGFVARSRFIFLSKAVLHFDYLVLLKAIQAGLFHSGLFSWD